MKNCSYSALSPACVGNRRYSPHAAVAAVDPEPGDEIISSPITDMGAIRADPLSRRDPGIRDVDPRTCNDHRQDHRIPVEQQDTRYCRHSPVRQPRRNAGYHEGLRTSTISRLSRQWTAPRPISRRSPVRWSAQSVPLGVSASSRGDTLPPGRARVFPCAGSRAAHAAVREQSPGDSGDPANPRPLFICAELSAD